MVNANETPHDHKRVIQADMRVAGSPLFLANERAFSGMTCCGDGAVLGRDNNGIIRKSNDDSTSEVQKAAETFEFKQTEDFLAAEMNKLSFQERNQAHEDVHCVGKEMQEDPNVVEQTLQAFQQEVDNLKPQSPVYQAAEAINADYVNDRSFRLKFLRASMYDVKKAVHQMMKFLEYKEKYFGKDKLCKEIDLSDLTEEDRTFMKTGAFLVSKHRDRSGRAIIQFMNTKLSLGTAPSVIRLSYYIWWNLLIPLEEVQLKGLVGIYYDIQKPDEKTQPMKLNDAVEIMKFALTLPFRYSSCLCCLKEGKKSSLINNSILGVSTKAFSNYIRVRTRLNYGSDLELQYHLQSLGIPLKDFPVDTEGNLRQDVLEAWCQGELEKCKTLPETNETRLPTNPMAATASSNGNASSEFANSHLQPILPAGSRNHHHPNPSGVLMVQPPSVIVPPLLIQPRPQDVLFGRGVGCQNHAGNIRFREIMESYKEEYDNVPRSKRRVIMSTLRHALQVSGTRFLRFNKDGNWEECNAAEVDTKIGQFFRSRRKNKRENGTGTSSSK